ncbi:MAG: hypothetical protein EPO35_05990 [Acidobacteria bacterium]|nr:MAG: hypothetical protein EPO35_05990 [Acidobacteriota bacterium]
MTFLYGALLVVGVVLLATGLARFRERVTFVLIGLGISLTQAVLLLGDRRSTQGAIVFFAGTSFGILGSLKLIKDVRRKGTASRS